MEGTLGPGREVRVHPILPAPSVLSHWRVCVCERERAGEGGEGDSGSPPLWDGGGGLKGRCFLQISYSRRSSSRTECVSNTDLSSITEEFYSPRTW